ncbi:two-component system alkaline phosphatase synthesis response regulator PhoP [Paenibacillus cellulosilyticus]|uniref:Two-component system alkaline phosphatase synthesis response regulator PhoP n=1 Tax=Paenibacillus cellulosilyticus TaxID=375489 RepID=A0A2V2Z0C2_9BACL|nr:response regulator transcription factor [Paenibacillus cellulosilyticus]PWW08514.1 two-component system alkaline phosphatase synthesis response regulator PhoP [Paenibacillus cellulosilyticus]
MFRTEQSVEITKPRRIMIVSRQPHSVQETAALLMGDGFDVFMTHQCPEKALIAQLAPDMMIYDLSAENKATAATIASVGRFAVQEGVARTLFLVSESTLAHCLAAGTSEELLVWPGSPSEVLLHVRRIVRSAESSAIATLRTFKDLMIDTGRMAVYRDGRELKLTRTEYDLLLVLIHASGSVLSREVITEKIWGCALFGSSNTVDVHIKTLRKKLSDNALFPKYVATVRGVGYRLADERPAASFSVAQSATYV